MTRVREVFGHKKEEITMRFTALSNLFASGNTPIFAMSLPRALLILSVIAAAAVGTNGFRVTAYKNEAAERIAEKARSAAGRQELLMMSERYHMELVENAAQAKAEQEQQGKGFKIKFVPQNSSVYDPTTSTTFKVIPNQVMPPSLLSLNVHAADESSNLADPKS